MALMCCWRMSTCLVRGHTLARLASRAGAPSLPRPRYRGLARLSGAGAEALLARYAAPEEVLELPCSCAACGAPGTTRMYQTDIPFFKVGPSVESRRPR